MLNADSNKITTVNTETNLKSRVKWRHAHSLLSGLEVGKKHKYLVPSRCMKSCPERFFLDLGDIPVVKCVKSIFDLILQPFLVSGGCSVPSHAELQSSII